MRTQPTQHVTYPHEPGRLFDCPACEAKCHFAPGDTEYVCDGQHNGSADPGLTAATLCCNCGRTADQAGCPLRTRVIDWRTEYMCARCVTTFDWSDWDYDGVATYRRRNAVKVARNTAPSGCVLCRRIGHPLSEPCLP